MTDIRALPDDHVLKLTLDTYSHVLPDMQQAAVSALDAVFGA